MILKSKFLSYCAYFTGVLSFVFSCTAFANDHVAWLDLSDSEFKKRLDEYDGLGYIPIDFEVIVDKTERSYALIMEKADEPTSTLGKLSKVKWIVRKQLADKEFKDVWRDLLRKGYRPIDIESYEYENHQYYGAIWIKDKEISWVSYRDLSTSEFDLVWDESKASNQIPADINAYANKGKLKFSAIFVDNSNNTEWFFDRKVSYQDLSGHILNMTQQGFRMLDSSAYIDNSRQNYSVLWVKDGIDWRFEREVEFSAIEAAMVKHKKEGFGLVDVEVYVTRIGLRYTGIWIKE